VAGWYALSGLADSSTSCIQGEVVKTSTRLAGIAATLMHVCRAVDRVGRAFTTEKNAYTEPSGANTATGALNMHSYDSMKARNRLRKLKSIPSSLNPRSDRHHAQSGSLGTSGSFCEDDDEEEAPVGELLPVLRDALPKMNLPTRGHAAAAALLARTLHTESEVLPVNLINLMKRCASRCGHQ
jgi:hypothetical protein